MTRLLFATRNAHKTRELAAILGGDFALEEVSSRANAPEIIENGKTFAENASIKALAISRAFPQEVVIADDSGLEVLALEGAPGIFSARYAGAEASDRANVEKLLFELRAAKSQDRSARFVCVIALAKEGKMIAVFEDEIRGAITEAPRGQKGFGYDPVFVPAGSNKTFAELPLETKNKISHRARAAKKLREYFRTARPSE